MKTVLAQIQALEGKLAGETGPRGGKIIGKTKSGKPIYDKADHPAHKDFSQHDHWDAAHAHMPGKGQVANPEQAKKHMDLAHNDDLWDESGEKKS